MKNFKFKKPILTTLVIFLLLLPGCGGEFISVNQPCTTDPNSYFEVQISVSAFVGPESGGGYGYFGILIPNGWTTTDSIMYIETSTNDTAFLNFSESVTQQMSLVDPPLENYHWWVGSSFVDEGVQEFIIDLTIFTDNQTGYFLIDYMLGDDYWGLNYERSNDHLIIIGEVPGCFPEGLFLTNQEEIDNFQANNPGCTVMAGDVIINGDNITNLYGLDSIICIKGSLKIIDNPSLSILTGLAHLDSINGSLYIENNDGLTAISGLNHLTYLGRDLRIENDSLLTTIGLTSFETLNTVGRNLKINNNSSLANMPGLINLSSIAGDLEINQNPNLTNLAGLNNLTFIGDDLQVLNNTSLTNLTGLENMTFIDGDITIFQNHNLTNLTGLNNMASIYGNFDLKNNYNLLSLSSLENLILIGGYLTIEKNHNLTSLSGLENLTSIGGFHLWHNNSLTSLTDFEDLTSIGGSLVIGHHYYGGNPQLTSLTGLESLTSIEGYLNIHGNNALTSLEGLDNIVAGSITDLYIGNNSSLSTCAVQSICDYLAAPNGAVYIFYNAPGCNSQAQVEEACETLGMDEPSMFNIKDSGFNMHCNPNPFNTHTTIEFKLQHTSTVSILIFNAMGVPVAELHPGKLPAGQQRFTWFAGDLPKGVYLCRLQAGNRMITNKLIITE